MGFNLFKKVQLGSSNLFKKVGDFGHNMFKKVNGVINSLPDIANQVASGVKSVANQIQQKADIISPIAQSIALATGNPGLANAIGAGQMMIQNANNRVQNVANQGLNNFQGLLSR